jgi:hypothetical protein
MLNNLLIVAYQPTIKKCFSYKKPSPFSQDYGARQSLAGHTQRSSNPHQNKLVEA